MKHLHRLLLLIVALSSLALRAEATPVLYTLPAAPDFVARAKTEYAHQRGIKSARLVRGSTSVPEIALTFDDGPHFGLTEKLLDILRTERVHATFFVVGKEVDLHPELAREELADGHELANHTYSHLRLPSLTPDQVEAEMRGGALAVTRAVGAPTRLFRPPGGEYDEVTLNVLKRLGYVMVLWTEDPGDWARPSAAVLERRVLDNVENGSIILLHDGIPETMQMLPDLIHKLKARGYRFVTASEMALRPGAHVTGGPRVLPRLSHGVAQRKAAAERLGGGRGSATNVVVH